MGQNDGVFNLPRDLLSLLLPENVPKSSLHPFMLIKVPQHPCNVGEMLLHSSKTCYTLVQDAESLNRNLYYLQSAGTLSKFVCNSFFSIYFEMTFDLRC